MKSDYQVQKWAITYEVYICGIVHCLLGWGVISLVSALSYRSVFPLFDVSGLLARVCWACRTQYGGMAFIALSTPITALQRTVVCVSS